MQSLVGVDRGVVEEKALACRQAGRPGQRCLHDEESMGEAELAIAEESVIGPEKQG